MLAFSNEFRNAIAQDNRDYLLWVDITLTNGTVLHLGNSDLWANTFKIQDATSASNKFTIGAAVTGKFSVSINNIYETYSEYDFSKAVVIPYIGMNLSTTTEKVRVGTYIVDSASYNGSIIALSCLDYMSKFNATYSSGSSLKYPATLLQIVQDACTSCGVELSTTTFPNSDYSVATKPDSTSKTFGDIIACAAQLAGCFAKINPMGSLKFTWYDMEFLAEKGLDGGFFDETTQTSYQTGDTKDGGNFKDYSSGDTFDGGSFEDTLRYHNLYATSSFDVATDDVIITGVSVKEEFTETSTLKKQTYLAGTDGYVVTISSNVLIQSGQAETVAKYLFSRVGGMKFRPFTISCSPNPAIESGDIAFLVSRKSEAFKGFISNRTFTIGNFESISCDAESPLKNSSKTYNDISKAVAASRVVTEAILDEKDFSSHKMANTLTQTFGMYETDAMQSDNSIVYYIHNKPTVGASTIIWKMEGDNFSVSTDGGTTWKDGIDSSGNVVLSMLDATGVNANWIRAGTLTNIPASYSGMSIAADGSITFSHSGVQTGKLYSDGSITDSSGTVRKMVALESSDFLGIKCSELDISDSSGAYVTASTKAVTVVGSISTKDTAINYVSGVTLNADNTVKAVTTGTTTVKEVSGINSITLQFNHGLLTS